VSEDKPVQAGAETGTDAAPAPSLSADPSIDRVVAAALQFANAASPSVSPDHEAPPKPDAPKAEATNVGAPSAETRKPDLAAANSEAPREAPKETLMETPKEAPKFDAPKVDASRPEPPPMPGKLLIMSHTDRIDDAASHAKTGTEHGAPQSGRRRVAAMVAAVLLAALAGALGGALATAGVARFAGGGQAAGKSADAEARIARLEAEISNMRLSVEHNSKMGMSQFNKTSERIDRLEKAQAEPAAKLAKLSEAVEKLHAAPPAPVVAAAAPVPAREITGTVTPVAAAPAAAPAAAVPPKTEVARLPTVEGWVLRDVSHGSALIEGRTGLYEVFAGDPVPGLGRVDAIRRQDGHWVVVTSRGLIVAR
jgi:hypothetical protein